MSKKYRRCIIPTCKFYNDNGTGKDMPESNEPENHEQLHTPGEYFCYFDLHVGKTTYHLNVLIPAQDIDEAFEKMDHARDNRTDKDSHSLQPKGCLGKFNIDYHRQFMTEIGGGAKIV